MTTEAKDFDILKLYATAIWDFSISSESSHAKDVDSIRQKSVAHD